MKWLWNENLRSGVWAKCFAWAAIGSQLKKKIFSGQDARMKALAFLVVLASAVLNGSAAAPRLSWVRTVSVNTAVRSHSWCYAAAADKDGNIYVGSGPNIGLSKFDPDGKLIWSYGLETNDSTAEFLVKGLSINDANQISFSGAFSAYSGPLGLDGFTYDTYESGMFFARISSSKHLAFSKIAGNLLQEGGAFAGSTEGGFLMGGAFYGSMTYEGIRLAGPSNADIVVFKLNPDGSPVWSRRGTSDGWDSIEALALTRNGDSFVAGTSLKSGSLGMGGITVNLDINAKSLFLVKLNPAGDGVWVKSVRSSMDAQAFVSSAGAYSEKSQSYVWAGDFVGSQNIESHQFSSVGEKDVFVAKINADGNTSWVRTFGGSGDQFSASVLIDPDENIYVAGFFYGKIVIGEKAFSSRGAEDIFVAKLRPDGSPFWAKHLGFSSKDHYVSLALTKKGELLVAGSFEGGLLIDQHFVEGIGAADGFIAKFEAESAPPRITNSLQNQIVSAGMTVTLTPEVVSPLPVRYQWWFNGAPLSTETNESLTISSMEPSHAGSYFVVVQNEAGVVESNPSFITYTDASTLLLSIHPSLTVYGAPGKTYRIEYATETKTPPNWITATNLLMSTTPQVWVDVDAAVTEQRFYRVTLQPDP